MYFTENLDTTVVELLPKADDEDEAEETSLKGATAAPHERLMLNSSRLPNKDTFSVRNVKKFPSSPASKISAPIVPQQPSSSTKLYSSTPVKSDVIISVETNQKNDNVENLIDHYSKPSTDKSVLNIPVVLESDVQDTERGIYIFIHAYKLGLVRLMLFNATFNNMLVISWRSVLLVEETRENHRPVASHRQTLSHNFVSSTPRHEQSLNSQL